jgi:hypothetical protein
MSKNLKLNDAPMVHLTLCGASAGRPLCDCDKEAELNRGCLFWHAVYAPPMIFSEPKLCPKCKAEWDACNEEENHAAAMESALGSHGQG